MARPLASVAFILASSGCGMSEATLGWSFDGLPPLEAGSVYEGWLVTDGEPISTGTFTIGSDGAPDVSEASVTSADADAATAFLITIESDPDPEAGPSTRKLLGGDLISDVAELSVAHPAALGSDFADAAGSYILSTPTTAADTADYANGIWYVDPAGPGPSLDLPTLPSGFVYEAWVVDAYGAATSTGRFSDLAAADSDGPGTTAGSDAPPPFPGQDFITPPRDLRGQTAAISIEPEPDDASTPFAIKPLIDAVIDDPGAGVLQPMAPQATYPTGSAWFE